MSLGCLPKNAKSGGWRERRWREVVDFSPHERDVFVSGGMSQAWVKGVCVQAKKVGVV